MSRLLIENTSDREDNNMAEWIECTLGDLVTFQRGHDLPKSQMQEGQYPVVGSNGIIGFHNKYTTDEPSITIGRSGNVGKPFIYYGKTWSHNTTLYIKDYKGNDPVFVFYFLKTLDLANYAGGSAVPTLNRNHIHTLPICVPKSVEQQKKIGLFLKKFDEKIKTNGSINNNLEQQASVLVRQYCESLTSSVELGTVLSFENGFAFQSSSYHEKGKYRIITIKNVQDGRIDAQGAACIDDIPPRMKQGCFLTIGDVLLSLTGNVGRVGIVCENDLLLNQRVAKFIPKDIRTLPLLYFYFRLHSTKISLETISKGTAQQNLSPIETLKLEIPYETKQALELSNLLQPIFDTIYQKNIENIQLAEIRDSLLPKLMSGELDVSDIDL